MNPTKLIQVACCLLLLYHGANAATMWYVEDNTDTSDSTSTWQQKLRLTFTAAASTSYFVQWTFEAAVDNASYSETVRIQVDDTTTHNEVAWQPIPDVATGWQVESGFFLLTTPAVGSHDIDLDYKTCYSGEIVHIRNVRLTVRVADV